MVNEATLSYSKLNIKYEPWSFFSKPNGWGRHYDIKVKNNDSKGFEILSY